jgi:chromosome segregation ATPase
MSSPARVTSVAALEDLRAALGTFGGEARDVLAAVALEIRRTLDWLDEQLGLWKKEVRRSEDEVFQARQELARRKMMRIGGRPPDCTEQEKALLRARARLEHAEGQVEKTRQWLRDLPTAVTEYEGRARQLQNLIEGDLPRATALLGRKVEALEAYVALTATPPSRSADVPSPPPAERKVP